MVDPLRTRASWGPIDAQWWKDRAIWTRERLSALGVGDPPGNRFRHYCGLLDQIARKTESVTRDDGARLALIGEAHRTVLSLHIAARAIARPSPEVAARFEKALGGQLLPTESGDAARDTEFELTVAGLLTMGRIGVALGEPDLIAAYPLGEVGLAAKRISSSSKLRRRIVDGVEQLRTHGRRGYVVLNVDQQLAEVASASDPVRASEAIFDAATQRAKEIHASRTDPSSFIGVIGVGFQVRWDLDHVPAESGLELFLRCHIVSPDSTDQAAAQAFWEHLSRSIDDHMPTL